MNNYTLLYVLLIGFSSAMAQSKYTIEHLYPANSSEVKDTIDVKGSITKRFAVGLKAGAQLTWIHNGDLYQESSTSSPIFLFPSITSDNRNVGGGWSLGAYINGTIHSWESREARRHKIGSTELFGQLDVLHSQASTTYDGANLNEDDEVNVNYKVRQIGIPLALGIRKRYGYVVSFSAGYMPLFLLNDLTSITPHVESGSTSTGHQTAVTEELSDCWGDWESIRHSWFARLGACNQSPISYELEVRWGNHAQNQTYYKGRYLADTSVFAICFSVHVDVFRF